MASVTTCMFYFILLSTFSVVIYGENTDWFSESELSVQMTEQVTQLHFYFHDTISGKNPTAIQIAGPEDFSFGMTKIADEPLTQGPEPTSTLIGKAQGMYSLAAKEESGLLMVFSYAFLEGKYNGSTLSVLGRNPVLHPVREMPVVGGTGLFRFARGYALAKTVALNAQGDAIVEYNVTVIHNSNSHATY